MADVFLTNEVFGVSNEEIESYVERALVDELFIDGISRNKHIIVYGSSKQGKTALINKHLYPSTYIKVNCAPNTTVIDIYKSIIRQLGIKFEESVELTKKKGVDAKVSAKAKVHFPFFGSGEVGGALSGKRESEESTTYTIVEYNLELAQDISEILLKCDFKKRILLENFHYLTPETQDRLSFDLRLFEDFNILFIILGIWRERNRLCQYNGDLIDRLIEIPVEPWEVKDLKSIVSAGEPLLNVDFSDVIGDLIDTCFDSVGVFQELCKECCYAAGVNQTSEGKVKILKQHLNEAIKRKFEGYAGRHIRCIESFVEQKGKSSADIPLYIPYYFIYILFHSAFQEILTGFRRKVLLEQIKTIHHRPDDVRPSDIGYFVKNLVASQINRGISPPLFDYDEATSTIKVIDSTFYFFIQNCNRTEVFNDINKPVGL